MTRRGFLTGVLGTVAFRDTAWASLQKLDPKNAGPDDEGFWGEVRKHFILHDSMTSFNHVGLAPPSTEAFEEQVRQLRRAATIPTQIIWREQLREIEAVRNRIAKLIGAKPTEAALTYNATYGLQTGIMGWPLQKGDAIVTTSHDYSRAFTAIHQRCRRDGAELVEIPVKVPPASKQEVLDSWRDALKGNAKLAVMCSVTFLNGQILPVREIVELCHSRGVAVLIDGAQSIALLPTEFDSWGGEMYTACLHKWLMAPVGTGVFAVREADIGKVWSLSPSEESLEKDIKKFEQMGTRPLAPILAINQAIDFHEWLGMDRKLARLSYLREQLAKQILPLESVVHYGTLDSKVAVAMLTVGFRHKSAIEAANWLATEHKIHVTTALRGGVDGIRISPNVFTSIDEVSRLTKAIRDFSK
jgi:isopenicillin-N epimerase